MPRGFSRYDEARLQGQLWTPANGSTQPYAWIDASNLSQLTINSSGNVTAVAQGFGKTGAVLGGTGTVAYQAGGWVDGKSPCFKASNNGTGFTLNSSLAYTSGVGMMGFFLGNVFGSGFPNGYWSIIAGPTGGPNLRYRDDQVVDVLRNNQLGLAATPALSCLPGPHIAGFDLILNRSRVWLDGSLQANVAADPALSQPLTSIGYDPSNALGVADRWVECVIYDQVIPDWMALRVMGYLAWKWNVNGSPVIAQSWALSGNPYLSAPPLIGA